MDLPLEVFEDRTSSGAAASVPHDTTLFSHHPTAARPSSDHSSRKIAQQAALHTTGKFPQDAGSPTLLRGRQLRFTPAHTQYEAQELPVAQHSTYRGSGPQTGGHGPVRSCRSHAPSSIPYGRNWWGQPPQLVQKQQQQQQPYWMPAKGTPHHAFPQQGPISANWQVQHITAQPPLPFAQLPSAAPAVIVAPHPASASPQQPPKQRGAAQSPGLAAQSRGNARQSHGQTQPGKPGKCSAVPAKQKQAVLQQPVPQQPAPATQRTPGKQPQLLSQLHSEVEAFAHRASPTHVSFGLVLYDGR